MLKSSNNQMQARVYLKGYTCVLSASLKATPTTAERYRSKFLISFPCYRVTSWQPFLGVQNLGYTASTFQASLNACSQGHQRKTLDLWLECKFIVEVF